MAGRDHDIQVDEKESIYYNRDLAEPDPTYVNEQLDDVLHLYHSQRRRILVQRLDELDRAAEESATISHEQLARDVAAIEDGVDASVVNHRSLNSAKVGLTQNHFPLLESYGAIEWDQQAREIHTTEQTRGFGLLLIGLEEIVASSDIPDLTERRRARW